MEVIEHKISVRALVAGYVNDEETRQVIAFGGKLNVRPAYQREFVYKEDQQKAVIRTIKQGFPLNVMYWAVNEDGTFEVIDGQQRTISICEYVEGNFSIDSKAFHNLTNAEREQILAYELTVYWCSGTDKEKYDWFETINIAGEELSPQELRSAVYHGPWVGDARKYFSKSSNSSKKCMAEKIGGNYLKGDCTRQEYLQTVIKWISGAKNDEQIRDYMSLHQHDEDAHELKNYFKKVIDWVGTVYPKYYKEMKGIEWGLLYNAYKDKDFNAEKLEKEAARLMLDREVQNKRGIFEYLLSHNEALLNLRTFDDTDKRELYEMCGGICCRCAEENREKTHYEIEEMEADHIVPWSKGGKTVLENGQMLCVEHNRRKSNK